MELFTYTNMEKIIDRTSILQYLPHDMFFLMDSKKTLYNGRILKNSYLVDIMHRYLIRYYFHHKDRFNTSSLIMRDRYGKHYNYYLEYLMDKGYIRLVQRYIVGIQCNAYKISDLLFKNGIGRVVNNDAILMKKYNTKDNEDLAIMNSLIPSYIKIKLVKDLSCVKIDKQASLAYLNQVHQTHDVYNRNKYSVESILCNNIFHHFDIYGRLHTNFTILKSYIRKNCLSIDGESLMELDISNSQPLFLAKLINESTLEDIDPIELALFNELTRNGKLYDHISQNSDIKDKKETKEAVYRVLFGRNNYLSKKKRFFCDADIMFSMLFPTIHQYIIDYKKFHKDYKILSHKLQRMESNLIYNKIIADIMFINPDIKLITIHDSIMFQVKYKEIVTIIFNAHMKKEFNL